MSLEHEGKPGAAAKSRSPSRRRPPAARTEVVGVPLPSTGVVTERIEVAPRRGARRLGLWHRANRRVTVRVRSPLLWLIEGAVALGRRLLVLVKVCLAVSALLGALYGGRVLLARVVASPHFALREVRIASTAHVSREDLARLSGVAVGDPLLAIDPDAVAARLARHPWVERVHARRELPSSLVIEVVEHHAAALALIGELYLVDDGGHPFKRAALEETEGLVVLTGVSREQYRDLRVASEAAMREALGLLATYQHPDSLSVARTTRGAEHGRPALSEIHIDPRRGYTLVLYEGGGALHLGREGFAEKLARFDVIVADLRAASPYPPGAGRPAPGLAALRSMHLEGPVSDRVPVLFGDTN